MYTDPTGHKPTDWDLSHLTPGEIEDLEAIQNQWANADAQKRARLRSEADKLRAKYRGEDEYTTLDGHTLIKVDKLEYDVPAPLDGKNTHKNSSNINGTEYDKYANTYYNQALEWYNYRTTKGIIPTPYINEVNNGLDAIQILVDMGVLKKYSNEYKVALANVFFNSYDDSQLVKDYYRFIVDNTDPSGVAIALLTIRASNNSKVPSGKPNGKLKADIVDNAKESYNSAKTPRTGAEWNEYFKSKYGSGNVEWVTELKSYNDITMNPKALWGKSADDVGKILGEGWTRGTYGSAGTGWKFTNGDKSVFYHPGGGVHEGSYVGVSSGQMGKVKVVGSDYKPLAGDKAIIIQK